MTVKIKKLTPPQIAALREVLPNCVEAGIVSTTNSIVTFHDMPALPGPWRIENVRKLLADFTNRYDDLPVYRRLDAVLTKLNTRPDLVEEIA